MSQTDLMMIMPMEFSFLQEGWKYPVNIHKIAKSYRMNSLLFMDFMHHMGFENRYADIKKIEALLEKDQFDLTE